MAAIPTRAMQRTIPLPPRQARDPQNRKKRTLQEIRSGHLKVIHHIFFQLILVSIPETANFKTLSATSQKALIKKDLCQKDIVMILIVRRPKSTKDIM